MSSTVFGVAYDAADAAVAARFWAAALGRPVAPGADSTHAVVEAADVASSGPRLAFHKVPEGKTVKNRVHLDLRPVDRTREQEVERLLALGATQLADHRRPDGSGWITLADPEGNEFCILSRDPAGSGPTT